MGETPCHKRRDMASDMGLKTPRLASNMRTGTRRMTMRTIACIGVLAGMTASVPVLLAQPGQPATAPAALRVTVEAEEDVYAFQDAGNGAGPMLVPRLDLPGSPRRGRLRQRHRDARGRQAAQQLPLDALPAHGRGTGIARAPRPGPPPRRLGGRPGRPRRPHARALPLACLPDGRVMLSATRRWPRRPLLRPGPPGDPPVLRRRPQGPAADSPARLGRLARLH